MRIRPIQTTLLLGVVVLSSSFPSGVFAREHASNIAALRSEKPAPNGTTVMPTYHIVDTHLLSAALTCISSWCEADHFIRPRGGMVRCRTKGGYGAEVFICNPGDAQRCSTALITKAMNEIRNAGSPTGAVKHAETPTETDAKALIFGYEYFCIGGDPNCRNETDAYDAVRKHCNTKNFYERQIQYDSTTGFEVGDYEYEYLGPTWWLEPTLPPKQYTYGWTTQKQEEEEPATAGGGGGVGGGGGSYDDYPVTQLAR